MNETDIPQIFSLDLINAYHRPFYSGSGFLARNTVVHSENISFDVLAMLNNVRNNPGFQLCVYCDDFAIFHAPMESGDI